MHWENSIWVTIQWRETHGSYNLEETKYFHYNSLALMTSQQTCEQHLTTRKNTNNNNKTLEYKTEFSPGREEWKWLLETYMKGQRLIVNRLGAFRSFWQTANVKASKIIEGNNKCSHGSVPFISLPAIQNTQQTKSIKKKKKLNKTLC